MMAGKSGIKDWLKYEQECLLKALRESGSHDIDALCTKLPFKSKESIEKAISYFRREAEKELQKNIRLEPNRKKLYEHFSKQSALGESFQILNRNRTGKQKKQYIGDLIQMISECESHPNPSEIGGIDLSALYGILASAFNGTAPPHLNKETYDFLTKSLFEVGFHMKSNTSANMISEMSSFQPMAPRRITAVPENADNCTRALYNLRNNKHYNPLELPIHLLKKPKKEADKD